MPPWNNPTRLRQIVVTIATMLAITANANALDLARQLSG